MNGLILGVQIGLVFVAINYLPNVALWLWHLGDRS